jgi:hypothetical protein
MSCLSCKQLKEQHIRSFTKSFWVNRCEFPSSDQLRSHHTQDKLGALPGQLVACLFTVFISLDRISILDCLISVNILDCLISVSFISFS